MWNIIARMAADMGASSLLPISVIVLSICFGVKPGKALRSGLMIGAGFVGIGLMVDMMNSQLGTAAQEMSKRFGLNLSVVDLGWQGASSMAWASGFAAAAIPVAVLVNLFMLACRMTRTVNIDIWNIWHMAFTGAIVYAATESAAGALCGIVLHAALTYKLGDLWAVYVDEYFELTGLTVPHGTSAYMAPIACLVEVLIEKIPVLNQIHWSVEQLQEKIGVFAEPIVIGAVMGCGIGILAGYPCSEAFSLGVEMAAVMVFMPKIVKCIMEGLLPLSEQIKKILTKRFGYGDFYIGLDPAVLLGDSQVVTAGLLFIPLTLLIAILVPGNRVLPFGDLATISFFIAIAVAVHRGNLFRTLISGSLIMYLTIWIADQMVPWVTELGKMTGTIEGDYLASAMDQGGSPITYMVTQAVAGENIAGLISVGVFYGICLAAAYRCRAQMRS